MGAYDTIDLGDDISQVKIWDCNFKTYKIGDTVPNFGQQTNYNVALMEGGFAYVRANVLTGIFNNTDTNYLTIDKWGNDWTSDNYERFYKSLGG